MGAVTYPNPKVAEFIMKNLVPVQVQSDAQPISTDFGIKWTPTLIVLDPAGKEHHRIVGFLSPEELIPALLLGTAKTHFDRERLSDALSTLETLLKEYPNSDAAPEAVYLRGVAKYKDTHDPKPLKGAYEKLQSQYPSSEWTKRAYPYRLIQ
jgi:TolA-binding protein